MKRNFVLSLITAMLLLFSPYAYGDLLTVTTDSFNGNDFFFDWVFSFTLPGLFDLTTFQPDTSKHPGGKNDGDNVLIAWQINGFSGGSIDQVDSTVRLNLSAKHATDPHSGALTGGGEKFSIVDREIQGFDQQAEFKSFSTSVKKHKDIEGDHRDIYEAFYKRANNTFEIKLTGQHVPEPSTLTLFGIGIVALLGYRWREKRGRISGAIG